MDFTIIARHEHEYGLLKLLMKLDILKPSVLIDSRPIKFRMGNGEYQMSSFKMEVVK
jgi:hypothetical protein